MECERIHRRSLVKYVTAGALGTALMSRWAGSSATSAAASWAGVGAATPTTERGTMTSITDPEIKSVELSTGVRLEYVEQGDPAGTPVVLLHGYTDSWRSWELVLPHLPASVHAFALTQRGHGDAGRPRGYGTEDFAADVAAFIDGGGLRPAVVAGHSMGSIVAQRFAIDYPERTHGLVLASAATTWRVPVALELWEVVSTLEDPIDPDFVRDFQMGTIAQPVPPAFVDTVVAESLKVPARVWQAVLKDAILAADLSGELGAIEAPTMIVWGGRDFIPRGEQEAMLAAIADAQLVVYPDAGHALHWEQPSRFAADLVAFVDGLTG